MSHLANKNKIDPGFWIGLALIAALLYFQHSCSKGGVVP
jgi:hypothetical protein